ncbi:MAG: putative Zinc/iron permease [Candidatus Saccharibacteria bacterium]|nr:putative Zinc/iron permease [Candidatus Saccharibacteria bacterium]
MNEWLLLLIATTAGSLISLIGGVYLLYGKWGVAKLQTFAVPFAAGALLAAAFLDVLPEALHEGGPQHVLVVTLIGFLFFFVLERSLSWFHHHHEEPVNQPHTQRNVVLIIIGNTLHNFLDGLAIGASFLVNPVTGIVTAIAVAAHEIPRELGDFGLMLSKGMKPRSVLLVNFASAVATVLGAALVFSFGDDLPIPESSLLGITAGFFIYIAASDIVPTIHAEPRRKMANLQTLVLIFGVIFVAAATYFADMLV